MLQFWMLVGCVIFTAILGVINGSLVNKSSFYFLAGIAPLIGGLEIQLVLMQSTRLRKVLLKNNRKR